MNTQKHFFCKVKKNKKLHIQREVIFFKKKKKKKKVLSKFSSFRDFSNPLTKRDSVLIVDS